MNKDSLWELSEKLDKILSSFEKHPHFNKENVYAIQENISSFPKRIEEKPILLIVGDSKSGKSTFIELLTSFNPQTQSLSEESINLFKNAFNSENSNVGWHFSYHPGREIIISHDSNPARSFQCNDFSEAKQKIAQVGQEQSQGIFKVCFASDILNKFDILELPTSSKLELLPNFFRNKIPYLLYFKDLSSLEAITQDFISIFNTVNVYDNVKRPVSIIYTKKDVLFKITQDDLNEEENEQDDSQETNTTEREIRIQQKKENRMLFVMKQNEEMIQKYLEIKNKITVDFKKFSAKENGYSETISMISFLVNFLETKHPIYKQKFLIDNIHSLVQKISENVETILKNNLSVSTSLNIDILIDTTMEDMKKNEKMKELFNNIENIVNLKKNEPELYSQLMKSFNEKKSLNDMRKCLLNALNNRLNAIIGNIIHCCEQNLGNILKRNIEFPQLLVEIKTEILSNNTENSNVKKIKWVPPILIGVYSILLIVVAKKKISDFPSDFSSGWGLMLHHMFGWGLVLMLSPMIIYAIAISKGNKGAFESSLEILCSEISKSYLQIQNILKENLANYLETNLRKCVGNEFNAIQSSILEVEKSLVTLKKQIINEGL